MIILFAAAGLLAVLARRRAVLAKGPADLPAVPMPINANVSNDVKTAAENAQHWADTAHGDPSRAGSRGAGATPGPASQYLKGRGIVSGPVAPFPYAWSAPTAGRGPEQKPSWPGGILPNPGPFPPASGDRAYAQSPVRTSSPFLPDDLALIAPLASNSWFYNLSGVDPYVALAAGSGGYIDVQRVDPLAALRSATGGGR